jgi:LmbE family N-acetylglucosaminyl deacetylase
VTLTPSAGVDRPAPGFVVDGDHPGTSEAAWATSVALARIPALDPPDVDRVVVVAPHPDDEVLGAGGFLRTLAAAGVAVEICAVTDGEASNGEVAAADAARLARLRTAESHLALARLGVGSYRRVRLGHPDGAVAGHEADISRYLASRLDHRTLCLAPWRRDGHPDHDAVGRAAATAAAGTQAPMLEYLVWAWHWAAPDGLDLPWPACRRVSLARRVTASKRFATLAFRSQIRPCHQSLAPVLPATVLRRFWRPYEVYVS